MKSPSGVASATLELDLFPHPLPAGDAAGSGGWRLSFTALPPMTTAVSDASQQSYNWTRMNRGSDPTNQSYQLLDSSMGVRKREEAKKAEPRDKTMVQELVSWRWLQGSAPHDVAPVWEGCMRTNYFAK